MREMKDSGIEWIGEIPKEWKVIKTKYVADISIGLVTTMTANYVDNLDDGVYLIRNGDISLNKISKEKMVYISRKFVEQNASRQLLENDIVTVHTGYIGTSAIIREDFIGSVGFATIQSRPNLNIINERYLCWFYNSPFFIKQCMLHNTGDGRQNLNLYDFVDFYVYQPPLEEQQQIANFLDTKCSEIDATAEDIQKEITLLEDYKKSLVYNVISNGINHSIYSTENDEVWGNLPQGWKLVDIKYLFEIVKRIAGKEGYDVLSVTQKGLKIKDITSGDGQLADNYYGYQFVHPTDYVMNHMDLLTGWVDCSELFGVTSPDYRVFRLIDRSAHNLIYYKYVMQCCYMNKIFYSLGQGVSNLGRWRLQTSSFNNFKVPVPPKDEQDEIADFLDSKCSEIDSLIADKKRQLDILADYKKSLIYEYVTGKKEVPVNE